MSSGSSDDENFDRELLIRNSEQEAQLLIDDLLPQKSKKLYLKTYEDFMEWQKKNSASFDESVFLVYFKELSEKLKPPTLWSVWSKLKTTLNIKENINLEKYKNLKTDLTNGGKGYKPRKSKILSLSQIDEFLKLADDTIYLAMKAILIVGFFGALRYQEILNLKLTDIEDTNSHFIITINETKTYISRNFIISKEYYDMVKKYRLLRPVEMQGSDRFFVCYQKGKCVRQFIGKNKISEIPYTIATFRQLPEPEKYTGHCYRRSSATALSNAGGNLVLVKNHGGWRSDTVAQGYIDFSTTNRKQIFDLITNSHNVPKNHFLKHPPIRNILSTSNVSTKLNTSEKNANQVSMISSNDKIDMPSDESHVPSTSVQMNTITTDETDESEHVNDENTKDQDLRNQSNIKKRLLITDLGEPCLKKLKSSSSVKQNIEDHPKTIFQNCEIHNININYHFSYEKE